MSALVFDGPGKMSTGARPRPTAAAGEVVVRIEAAGICGSELTSFTGTSTRRAPGRVFGHELAGTVASAGPGVDGGLVGWRVTVNPLMPCGRCRQCLAGRSNACPTRVLLGMQVDGGFAEEVAVPVTAVYDRGELDDVGGSLVEPLANAVHVLELLPSATGRHIAVLGAGAIGLSVVSVLAVAGAARITVIDPVESRRQTALETGAHEALSPDEARASELVPDHVVDAAGTTTSRRYAIDCCDAGGCVVLLGLHTADSELPINAAVAKELRLQCSYAYTQSNFETALALLKAGRIRYEHWITLRPLDDGHEAFVALVERPNEVTKIILRP